MQEALGWIPNEFSQLTKGEVIKLDEDDEYFQVGLKKMKDHLAL